MEPVQEPGTRAREAEVFGVSLAGLIVQPAPDIVRIVAFDTLLAISKAVKTSLAFHKPQLDPAEIALSDRLRLRHQLTPRLVVLDRLRRPLPWCPASPL